MSLWQNMKKNETHADYSTAQTNTVVQTPASGKKLMVFGYIVSADTAMTVTITLGSTVHQKLYVGVTGGANLISEIPVFYGANDEALKLSTSAAGNASITLLSYEA